MEKGARKVLSQGDIAFWLESQAYRDYISFMKQLNEFAKRFQNDAIVDDTLVKTAEMLNRLSSLVDEVQPFDNDSEQRFGNKAYRVWFDEMQQFTTQQCQTIFGEDIGAELVMYLRDSFGNRTRIDYGTGHEMCFLIFMMGIHQLVLIPDAVKNQRGAGGVASNDLPREVFQKISVQLLSLFANVYMPLVRKVQLRYRLEPAGSHGAFSLDDFQFLPFYFGSAQLIGNAEDLTPSSFPEKAVAEKYSERFMFHSAVSFIHRVKSGPFAEHSNQLWNISAVPEWSKINAGLFKMYCNEYLPKFQIIQHLVFGERVFCVCFLKCQTLKLVDDVVYKFTYNIIHSSSYQVPVIYFRVENSSGMSVNIEWIWEKIPLLFLEQNSGQEASQNPFDTFGKIVTQTMHPIDGRPCFFIHPCKTSSMMARVPKRTQWYLVTWLSSIGPVIGLELGAIECLD